MCSPPPQLFVYATSDTLSPTFLPPPQSLASQEKKQPANVLVAPRILQQAAMLL